MSDYAIIVENGELPWDDHTDDLHHYPSRYRAILTPGCKVIYVKGRMRNKAFASERLSRAASVLGR